MPDCLIRYDQTAGNSKPTCTGNILPREGGIRLSVHPRDDKIGTAWPRQQPADARNGAGSTISSQNLFTLLQNDFQGMGWRSGPTARREVILYAIALGLIHGISLYPK